MSDFVSRRGAIKLSLLTMVATVAVAVPAAVWASHNFNDVATNHPFHDEISAIGGAGIATGFNDGGFHPSANVTRQAMAAFLERGIGRVGGNTTLQSIGIPPNSQTPVATSFLDAGAAGSGSGLVLLTGHLEAWVNVPGACPCTVQVRLIDLDVAGSAGILASSSFDIGGAPNSAATAIAAGGTQAIVPVNGDSVRRFAIAVFVTDLDTSFYANGSLTSLYVPIGADGDETAAYCWDEEGEPNDSMAAATPVTSGQAIRGCIEPAGDSDYFSITVPAGYHLSSRSTGLGTRDTCDVDTHLRIRNSAGTIIHEQSGVGGPCAWSMPPPLPGGTYYVEISGGTATATGSYWLMMTTNSPL